MVMLEDAEQRTRLLVGLLDLYKTQCLVDVTLVADNRDIPCHKNVLVASSPYFRAMFTNNLVEMTKEKVQMYEVDADALWAIVNYMYTMQITLDNSNVQNIFTTANLFEMLSLCELCAQYMTQQLYVSNCVGIYQFGSFHNFASLKSAGKTYVVDHFTEVSENGDILDLDFEDFVEILRDSNLNVFKEETVYETALNWLEKDLDHRACYLQKLFKVIRLPLISQKYVHDHICRNELIMNDSFCSDSLSLAKLYHIAKESLEEVEENNISVERFEFSAKPRLGMFNTEMLVFVSGSQEKYLRSFTCFDPRTRRNYYAIPPHVSFDFKYRIDLHRAVATQRHEVYMIGGIFYDDHHFEDAGPALCDVKLYDPHNKCWLDKAPLIEPRCAHAVAYDDGKIYVMGGKSTYPAGSPLDSVEVYDIRRDRWSYVTSLPLPLYHHQAVVFCDQRVAASNPNKILVIGGMTRDDQVTNTFLEYDILMDCWTSLKTCMHVPRAEFGATVVCNKLYVIGGTNGDMKLSSVEVFNLSTKRWQFAPDFPEDRKSMTAVTFDDCVYVCGGVRTLISRMNRVPRVVETRDLWKYDPETGFWTREVKLVQYANVHACVVAQVNTKRLYESDFVSSS